MNEIKKLLEHAGSLAHILLASIALVYGFGFLIVFLFFRSYGIDGVDLVEASYVHVGSLFFIACLVFFLICFMFKLYLNKDRINRLKTFFSPTWNPHPDHGLHISPPVIGTVTLLLLCFVLLVAFAPPSFADTFSKLVFFNILLPILILCIAIYADKHAGGQFNKTASRYLLIIRRILRIWFVALGVLYAIFYLSGRNTLDSHLRLQEVMLVAIPLIYILVCFLVLKKKNDANDTSAALWALYSIQWSLFVFQIGVFLSTIRNQNIDASLKEILFGKNWHTSKFIEDLASGNWEHGTNFPGGASYIILFWTLALLFLYRVPYRLRQYAKALEDNKNKAEELDKLRLQPIHIVVTTAVLVGIMFYFSILGFSRYVYPYIPSSKGGGDFTKSPQTHLTFNADGSAQYVSSYLPTNLIAINATNGLIILYENRDYAYLACRGDASGPMNWQSTASRPKVYEVPRKFITCVEYSNVFANVSNMISLHVSAPPRAKLSH